MSRESTLVALICLGLSLSACGGEEEVDQSKENDDLARLAEESMNASTGPSPGAQTESGWNLRCFGTEPFWSMEVGQDLAMFKTAEGFEVQLSVSQVQGTAGRSHYRTFHIQDGETPGVIAVKETKACSDGMSDNLYPFEVIVARKGWASFEGCCSLIEE